MSFNLIAIAHILTFKLTIKYNYWLNSNGCTNIGSTSTITGVMLDKY